MLRAKSLRSVHSIKSLQEDDSSGAGERIEIPSMIFEELLPYICRKFNCEFDIYVKRALVRDDLLQRLRRTEVPRKAKRAVALEGYLQPVSPLPSTTRASSPADIEPEDASVITVTALYDNGNRLTEIMMYCLQQVPHMVMQVVAFLAPNYAYLTKITIRRCGLHGGIINDLSRTLSLGILTDICLDDSFLPEQNFSYLLDEPYNLKHLSLARCRINDSVCFSITKKLFFTTKGEKKLLVLNLSGNCITDVGAKYLAEMLRSNRRLRYLNLASNRLTDDGSCAIFDVLVEFPLTYDEITSRRRRILNYMKMKRTLVARYMLECSEYSVLNWSTTSRKSTVKKVASKCVDKDMPVETKADIIAEQIMDTFDEPFKASKVRITDDWSYCKGNMTLSYLNLAYNQLTYLSVKRLGNVLYYQESKKGTESGLQMIVIEGNILPESCPEYGLINLIMNRNLTPKENMAGKDRRKSLTKAKTVSSGQLKTMIRK